MSGETKVNVLAVIRSEMRELHIAHNKASGRMRDRIAERHGNLTEAVAALAELIEAAKMVNGDHTSPHDCYVTGPLTGNPVTDLARCPGCRLAADLARIQSP